MTLTHDHNKAFMFKPPENLTIYHAVALKEQIASCFEQGDNVALDLSGVSEIDTAGLQLLILAKQHATRMNKSFQLLACSSVVDETLTFCNLQTFFIEGAG